MAFAADDRTTDESLIAAARTGDSDAFGILAERHRRLLTAYYKRLLWDGPAAEDGAQEVLLKVFRFLGRYESRARFTTFLFSVARNHGIDRMRSRRSAPRIASLDGEESAADRLVGAGARPDEIAASHELELRLADAIASLPAGQRIVIRLAALEGLAHRRIAKRLAIPLGTVKSRMHSALDSMRAYLGVGGREAS